MDARTPGRRAAHAAKMRRLIEAFSLSGSTQAEFCRKHGLALSTFGYWQRRCRTAAAPPFVEVTIGEPREGRASVELVLPGGLVARIDDGCSDDLLRRLLRVAAAPC